MLLCLLAAAASAQPVPENANETVQTRLEQAGANRPELVKALEGVAVDRRPGMIFLVENMPATDLTSLSATFLIENVNLAYESWEEAPWREQVSPDLFLNDVLPYACLTEPRDPWRSKLRELCAPLVARCKTPGEAAHLLNQKIFPLLNVRYNTARRRTDQSPAETIASGIATCTGLSILLVDACRSVGIPARIAGTRMWSNMRGNHTWVEIWDGDWHFAGAAEPDPAGLDHGWFVRDASEAKRDVPAHAIYATSFRRTGVSFPLAWRRRDQSVSAVNVTDRYSAKTQPAGDGMMPVPVRVIDEKGRRVAAQIVVSDIADPAVRFEKTSRDETADLNDLAVFELAPNRHYHFATSLEGLAAAVEMTLTNTPRLIVTLTLAKTNEIPPRVFQALSTEVQPLQAEESARLRSAVSEFFTADPSRQATWNFPAELEGMLARNEAAVRQVAWEAYREAPIHSSLEADFNDHLVRFEQHQSPYTVKTVGTRPAGGWALFIAMHGGGNAPKRVNDRQWEHMKVYYRDHPEEGGYLYLALRAPNDTWNGFYDIYVYPMIDNLIRQFRLFGDIDPDKVFIMGSSHGGYGAYAIGPKMPDRFAAIHASAAAGTDGETTGKTLLSTPFTAMVGERDTMYGRYERNLRFKEEIEQLRGGRTDIYPVTVTVVAGNGHSGLPDRDKIAEMYPAVRCPVPRQLAWLMTDSVVTDFFWLRVPQPGKQQEIQARCQENRFVITANESVSSATVQMDARLVDFSRPVDIQLNGSTSTRRFTPSLRTFCQTLARRGDPGYAFSAEFTVAKDPAKGQLVLAPSENERR